MTVRCEPPIGIYPVQPRNGGIVPPWLQFPKPPKETKR